MQISQSIKELSQAGIVNILSNYKHVHLFGDESRNELEEILQINVDEDKIDEIEIIMELSGE